MAPADRKRRTGEDVIEYAVATGRLPTARATYWRGLLAAGTTSAAQIEQLAPGLPPAATQSPVAAVSGPATTHAASDPSGLPPASGDPVLDTLRQMFSPATADEYFNRLSAAGRLPELFPGGAERGRLPAVTASGMPPAALASAPVWCRPAIAAAATIAEATELLQIASTPDGPAMLAGETTVIGPWREFQAEVQAAAHDAGTALAAQQNETARVAASRRQEEIRASAVPVEALSDDEAYDRLFTGSVRDRVKAERAEQRRRPGIG